MATRRKNPILAPLHKLFNIGAIGNMTDGQLLERFASGGEAAELAFAALVERHGQVVLHTCRSILRDHHEADDAFQATFQATFLSLVRKANSLCVRDSLGPWLHQVAYRAARYSRKVAVRRAGQERISAEMTAAERDTDDELGAALHEEIERLPERYRIPVVLCDLEGRPHEQAARHLGCPGGTVKSRLAGGRGRLKDRLTRRGLALPSGVLVAGLNAQMAPSVVESTVRAAMQFGAGRPAATVVSLAVMTTTKGILRELLMNSVKGIVLKTISIVVLAGGLAWAGFREQAVRQEPPKPVAPPPAALQKKLKVDETAYIRGLWEVVYVTGSLAGRREGRVMPGLIVNITDEAIDLPVLTGNTKALELSIFSTAYSLEPGRGEAEERVREAEKKIDAAERQLTWTRKMLRPPARAASKSQIPESRLIALERQFQYEREMLQKAERLRDETKAKTNADESRIDLGDIGHEKLRRGIYRRQGNVLTICYDNSDEGRPETFAVNKPSESLIIMQRGGGVLEPIRPDQIRVEGELDKN